MRWTVLAASLWLASAAQAGTLLFLNSQAGDYIGQGADLLITSADGTFTASRNFDNGVNVDFSGNTPGDFWSADFAAPTNATLVPGAYEGATRWPFQAAGSPGLDVHGEGRGCQVLSGRFVVLKATYDGSGKVQSFAADFEQHCENAVPALFGSVRYHAGDPGCAGQPDGTACDDQDACTQSDVCQAGRCAGTSTGACSAAPVACHTDSLCDPSSGACVGGGLQTDGTPCSDGDACTVSDSCQSGVCTAGDSLSCDDGDLCTDDICDPNSGCVFGPVPCWSITGTATVAGLGGIVVDPAPPRFATTLVLRPDGTYRLPSTGITDCGPEIPDEVGTYRRGRRRRLILTPSNLDEINAAGTICIGYPLTVTRYRTVVTLSRSGLRLHGKSTLAANLEILGQSIPFHAVAVFKGTRGALSGLTASTVRL